MRMSVSGAVLALLLLLPVAAADATRAGLRHNAAVVVSKEENLRTLASSAAEAATSKTEVLLHTATASVQIQSPHIHTLELRPTSTLLFADDLLDLWHTHGGGGSSNAGRSDRDLLERQNYMYDGAHGVYGTLHRLSPLTATTNSNNNDNDSGGSSAVGGAVDTGASSRSRELRDKIERHNQLLDQFNSERHLSRFERFERAASATAASSRASASSADSSRAAGSDRDSNAGGRKLHEEDKHDNNDATDPPPAAAAAVAEEGKNPEGDAGGGDWLAPAAAAKTTT
eukprot:CAMPEP_0178484298 /NCGR_PEP_ID=MMETSP0696-20121128/7680_1 /TAXON_ID=265572 /ORGANISM="Extubocellulus spinifer, Strain CCMP396" /LENGTH=284 /DNA_ID=CAMNT_0020111847 /DNA_START=168 /DNA_END=1018 /DNA_ORIENTATION=+